MRTAAQEHAGKLKADGATKALLHEAARDMAASERRAKARLMPRASSWTNPQAVANARIWLEQKRRSMPGLPDRSDSEDTGDDEDGDDDDDDNDDEEEEEQKEHGAGKTSESKPTLSAEEIIGHPRH